MGDLLVRLYDLPEFPSEAKVVAAGVTCGSRDTVALV